jgi:glutathione S-transferase
VLATVRVYHRERAGRPLRVIWMLEEVGDPYELTLMTRDESREEGHMARHPLGRVPVIEDDEGFLFESAGLCLHIGDLHPEAGLVPPPGTHDRALVYQWACFAPAELEPPLFEAWTQAELDPDRAAAARERFRAATGAVAGALDGQEHLVGGRFTVADVLIGTALLFTTRAKMTEDLTPPLTEYVGRLAERPAFQRAMKRTFG